jgi:CheY-like chemotaxis protein
MPIRDALCRWAATEGIAYGVFPLVAGGSAVGHWGSGTNTEQLFEPGERRYRRSTGNFDLHPSAISRPIALRGKAAALPTHPVIAIIDDDESVRATTDSLVRSLGYIVYTFASAEAFLRSSHLNDTSCVIADVQMSAMSGVELQAHLLTQGHRVPFIFVTAFPDARTRARALRAGAVCYLTKPFEEHRFIECLDAALQ